MKNGDSTLWKIKWTGDCSYTVKYLYGNGEMSKDVLKFLKNHKLAYEITKLTNDYCVFKTYIDDIKNNPIETDTMWLAEKTVIANNELFTRITAVPDNFRDTSQYALIYVYRPWKFTNSLGNFLVYMNDNLMFVARNRSGYIYKVMKEGRFSITSRLYKDESTANVDIRFGKIYYAKAIINWGLYRNGYNFKLEMAMVDEATGRDEFEKTRMK